MALRKGINLGRVWKDRQVGETWGREDGDHRGEEGVPGACGVGQRDLGAKPTCRHVFFMSFECQGEKKIQFHL